MTNINVSVFPDWRRAAACTCSRCTDLTLAGYSQAEVGTAWFRHDGCCRCAECLLVATEHRRTVAAADAARQQAADAAVNAEVSAMLAARATGGRCIQISATLTRRSAEIVQDGHAVIWMISAGRRLVRLWSGPAAEWRQWGPDNYRPRSLR